MRLAASQFHIPAVREQAVKTLAAGQSVTLTAPLHVAPVIGGSISAVGEAIDTGPAADILYGFQAAGVRFSKPTADSITGMAAPLNMAAALARDAAVEHLKSLHPTLGTVLGTAFTIFDQIEAVSVVKVGDKTVGTIVVTAIGGLRRHFMLRPHIDKDYVEIGIQEHRIRLDDVL